ncbi:Ger(x)C family spore germination protein [Tepidimicrobium xylanilyticum]|uniref:Ger(x)C family spore germination protein n=1 Tax=Tepidimicrobium xylanilyticum TaxID=1123352 RepID=UPI002656A254|nr:Ger(x)C family spore germination protein [Tepidimicrobium xylanilyticum]GMG95253.1 germination protein GerC [Tepidimicrobium xylanilyticum]
MKKGFFLLLMISLVLLCGCWDKVEVDQRIFVSSIGVDLYRNSEMNRYIVTYEYPNINSIGKNATEDQKTFIRSTPASSIFQASSNLSTQTPFPFYFKHLKVLVLGEDLLGEEKLVRQVIDELNRDTKVNKNIQVLAADGKVTDIINANVVQEQTTDGVLYTTVKDNRSSSRYTAKTLTDLITDLDIAGVTIIPRVLVKDGKFLVSGGCVLKNYRHAAWICEKENRAISFLRGNVKTETIDAVYNGNLISYTITEVNTDKKVKLEEKIKAVFSIGMEGYLQGYIIERDKTVYDSRVLEEMEKALEKEVKKEIEDIIRKLQKTYRADVIGVGEYLSKFRPKKWAQVKDDWDNIFPDIDIEVLVNVNIRRIGLTK